MAIESKKPGVRPKPTANPTVLAKPKPGVKATAPIKAAAPVKPSFKIVSSQDRKKYLKLLVYGDYGAGKTFLTGTAAELPELRDVLLISAEAGDLTLQNADPKFGFDHIDHVECTNYSTVARVYEFLKAHCALRDRLDSDEPGDALEKLIALEARLKGCDPEDIDQPRLYQTVIVDSLSEIDAYSMNQLLGISDASRLDSEVLSAEWAEYKKNNSSMQRFLRNFRNLPMTVIFTCARQYSQDDQKKFHFTLGLTGQLARQVQGFMDMVGYLVMGPQEVDGETKLVRRLYVQPVGRFSAKCRFSNFKGNYFDNPTIKSILSGVGMLNKPGPKA